jgi:hypothetical protein
MKTNAVIIMLMIDAGRSKIIFSPPISGAEVHAMNFDPATLSTNA